uniref:Monodehydroascorbate reductase n=1 Tax=Tanacetum cinerariifolium TaxID=118510 RepID=A0A6L2MGN3_TANCI|nr:hypothetical protein [Tanacetum cinerariifolium]
MDTKKHIIDLESFRDILQIYPRVLGQLFTDPLFEEEILAFIRFLRHGAAIRTPTDVNINKLYQSWRSFAALINKCLTRKSSGYDSLRLFQAQILWGLYHKRNIDYAYLMWQDFVYQVEHKNQKKSNEMYYPRFTKAIIHHFMSKDPLIPRRNKVNWHYVRNDFMNSKAYKEYYAIATGEAAPKPKASVKRTRSSSDTSITPSTTAASSRPKAFAKGKQTAKASKAKSLSALSEVAMTEAQQLKLVLKQSMQQTHISQPSGLGADEGTGSKPGTPTSVAPLPITTPTMTSSTIATTTQTSQSPTLPTTIPSEVIQHLPSFGSLFRFDDRLRLLEQNFFEVIQTNQFAGAVSAIPGIIQHYMDQQMNEAVQVAIQLQSDRLREEAQRENDEFPRTVDEYIKKIIREQVKEQVKDQVSKILPRIEQAVNEQLEAEVLTKSSHSSRTSYAVAADLSEMELKKILIEKMKGNKSIQRSDEQRNLYKALVDAYESDKIILDTYEKTVTLKRRRDDDEDKDEEPSAGPDQGSKKRKEGKEPESASTPSATATKSAGMSTTGSKS